MISVFKETNVNFIRIFRYVAIVYAVLFIAGVVSLVVHKGPRYGVDFTGGTILQIKFDKPISTETMRNVLSKLGEGNASIQKFGEGYEFLIRVESRSLVSVTTGGFSQRVKEIVKTDLPGYTAEIGREETVGPRIGKELQTKALLAVLAAWLGILIYVAIRFDIRFGVGAVIALIYDVTVVVGLLSIFNKEITIPIVAALLTIIGFDVNDSIVVSDRIRENLRKMRREPFDFIVNRGINETLSRTIITSFTVLIISVLLWLIGAPAIKDFAFAMTIGIILGTASSIFIVAPLVVFWERRFPKKRKR
jgi:preprotein translocase subunit SecF